VTELLTPQVPRLVLQGSKDTFGTAGEIRTAIGEGVGVTVVELPDADHGFRIGKSSAMSPADLHMMLITQVSRFIAAELGITTP
jgi:predicted alpha/beta-hydrolase family hydrolase